MFLEILSQRTPKPCNSQEMILQKGQWASVMVKILENVPNRVTYKQQLKKGNKQLWNSGNSSYCTHLEEHDMSYPNNLLRQLAFVASERDLGKYTQEKDMETQEDADAEIQQVKQHLGGGTVGHSVRKPASRPRVERIVVSIKRRTEILRCYLVQY